MADMALFIQEKGVVYVPVPTPDGGVIWVYPDLIEDKNQWTTVLSKKYKGKAKASSCNVVCAFLKVDYDDPPLTDFEQETIVLVTQTEAPLVAKT